MISSPICPLLGLAHHVSRNPCHPYVLRHQYALFELVLVIELAYPTLLVLSPNLQTLPTSLPSSSWHIYHLRPVWAQRMYTRHSKSYPSPQRIDNIIQATGFEWPLCVCRWIWVPPRPHWTTLQCPIHRSILPRCYTLLHGMLHLLLVPILELHMWLSFHLGFQSMINVPTRDHNILHVQYLIQKQ